MITGFDYKLCLENMMASWHIWIHINQKERFTIKFKSPCENEFYAYLLLVYEIRSLMIFVVIFKISLCLKKNWVNQHPTNFERKKKLKNVPNLSVKGETEVLCSCVWASSENHDNSACLHFHSNSVNSHSVCVTSDRNPTICTLILTREFWLPSLGSPPIMPLRMLSLFILPSLPAPPPW